MISELDIAIATTIFGLALIVFWKRALHIYMKKHFHVGEVQWWWGPEMQNDLLEMKAHRWFKKKKKKSTQMS